MKDAEDKELPRTPAEWTDIELEMLEEILEFTRTQNDALHYSIAAHVLLRKLRLDLASN